MSGGGGGGTITRTDNFNRADDSTGIGTPSDGGSAWIARAGHWGISANEAYPVIGSSAGIAAPFSADMELAIATLPLSPNGVLQLDITNAGGAGTSGSTGLIFRIQDNGNYWITMNNGNYFYLYKVVAGVKSTIVSAQITNNYPITAPLTYIVELLSTGFNIKSLMAGVTTLEIPSTDTAFASATEHGIVSGSVTNPRVDNFSFVGT